MSSEAECGSVHEVDGEGSRPSEQSSILSFMAATWDYYGGKYVTTVYACRHVHINIIMDVHITCIYIQFTCTCMYSNRYAYNIQIIVIRLQGLLHSLLLCHLTSCDQPSRHDNEPLALSLSVMAKYLAEMVGE